MFSKKSNPFKKFVENTNKLAQTLQPQQQNVNQSSTIKKGIFGGQTKWLKNTNQTNQKSVDERVAEGFNHAVNFYNAHPNRTLDEQWQCLAEMQKITGFDDEVCAKIQSPILSILQYQSTVSIANEAIQNQLRIVTDQLRNRLLDLQPKIQPDVIKEIPYIPKVPSKPTVVDPLDELVKGQISSDGDYPLVNFSNKDLPYKSIDKLLYGKGRTEIDPTKNIYQGMLAKQGVTIVKLDMSNCNINSLGSFPLGQSLYENSNLRFLQYLNLSNNKITDDGILSFGNQSFCKTSPSLISLNLSNNLLTDNGVNSLSWSLKNNNLYYLKNLNISGNKITDDGALTIAEALKTGKFPTLKRFDASGNDISLVGEKFMLDALKHSSTQSVILLLKRSNDLKVVLSGSKEEKQKLIKATLQTAQDNDVDVKNVAVSKGILGFLDNLGYVISDFSLGFTKCNIVPEDAETFAMEAITAKISKKAIAANTAKDTVVCLFDTIDDVVNSSEGIQLIKDLDLYGANSVIDSIE